MSRDISMVSSQREVVKGGFDTSFITDISVECFDPGHKIMFRDTSNSRLAKPSPCYLGEEEANPFVGKDFHGEVPWHLEGEEAEYELQKPFMERSYTGEYASTVCHAQNTEENMRDNASQDMRSLQLENRGNNAVAYCVDLLQHDPGLQAVIVSLASDPAVWEAFQRNEKIQELMQTRKARCLRQDAVNHIGATFLQHRAFQMNPFLVALCCVRNIVWDSLGKSINLVGNILSFADRKIFGERSSDPLDDPFKACIVVTMLALALVVLKRESN